MNLEANDLMLFSRVAETGSFSRGAERVGLPKSTVSRRIAGLEAQLGERLFLRSTRKLTLTEFGESLLDHARRLSEEVEAASALAQHRQAEPSGRLRVSMPNDFAEILLPRMFATFTQRYPDVALDLDLSPRRVDLLGEGFDLAIRMGSLSDDATLVARKVCEISTFLYAAPSYAERHGLPAHPDELQAHLCLQIRSRDGNTLPWRLRRDGKYIETAVKDQLKANSLGLLMHIALEGAGIAMLTERFAAPFVKSNRLVRVLPEWDMEPVTAWAVLPGRRLLPAKTRVFLELLNEALQPDAPMPVACKAHHERLGLTEKT
jgi:DNA-binding transcriptional LysR family regulator